MAPVVGHKVLILIATPALKYPGYSPECLVIQLSTTVIGNDLYSENTLYPRIIRNQDTGLRLKPVVHAAHPRAAKPH
jgi:hypothetical protein